MGWRACIRETWVPVVARPKVGNGSGLLLFKVRSTFWLAEGLLSHGIIRASELGYLQALVLSLWMT